MKLDRPVIDKLIERRDPLQAMTEEGMRAVLQILDKLSPEKEQIKALEPLLLACLLSIDNEDSKEMVKKFLKRLNGINIRSPVLIEQCQIIGCW